MAKQQVSQRYIFKIHSSRLKKAKWNLTLPLAEARKNEEVISLNDSQMLRWIDELNGVVDAETRTRELRRQIRALRHQPSSVANRREIRRLYGELDEIQFKPDYIHVVMDHDKDMFRACKGFKVNGIKYVRLLGTPGGIKTSTIVFVSERLSEPLRARIDNDRDKCVPQVPAKLEAYRALTCSGSQPVSMPHGILVVPDCMTKFTESVITLDDGDTDEPVMKYVDDYEVELDESDGYGLMLPSLAERWSNELKLSYTASAMCTRCAFEKGMVFTFDFLDFADKIAGGNYIVKDAWGDEVDIRQVELILTTSMLKLWKCYPSLCDYIENCTKNHYTFGVTKTSPRELENERGLNYQFIQPNFMTDEQIDELCKSTVDDINDILSDDYRKTILYLAGMGLSEKSVLNSDPTFIKALMIDKRMFDDPFVKRKIFQMIRKRIDEAKIGILDVHGNYSMVCGDPFALCQSIFGLPVTGLLKAGEVYNKYWVDAGVSKVACYRAPMSCANNIRIVNIASSPEMEYWYQYIKTCTLVNAWDSLAAALNGMD